MLYKEPHWTSQPLCQYSIQVINQGVITSEYDLTAKPYFSIGNSCDIPLEELPVSALILQHSDQGYLFVYKPDSQGTAHLNKEEIKANEYIRVYPNDMLEFEGTNDLIVIMGPSFMQRTEKMFTKQGKLEKNVAEKLQQISWGFGEDAVNEYVPKEDQALYDEVLDLNLLKSRKNITDKQRKLISKLEQYQDKVSDLQEKIAAVPRSKNSEGRLEELNEKLENLQGEKELAEENLRSSFFPENFVKKNKVKGEYDFSSSEDEYYNRAKILTTKDYNKNLQLELDRLVNEREEITSQLTELSVDFKEDTEDPLDAYMMGNNQDLKEENFEKLGNRLKRVLEKIQEIEQENPNIKGNVRLVRTQVKTEIREGKKKRKIQEEIEELPEMKSELKAEIMTTDFNAVWEPPPGQTGDGKTDLNAKYGY